MKFGFAGLIGHFGYNDLSKRMQWRDRKSVVPAQLLDRETSHFMRELGSDHSPSVAGSIADYLLAQGIKTEQRPGSAGSVSIWVMDEDKMPQARQAYEKYLANPSDPAFVEAARKASEIRKTEAKKQREFQKKVVDAGRVYDAGGTLRRAPVVAILIAASVAMSLWTNFGKRFDLVSEYVNFTVMRIDDNDGPVMDKIIDGAIGPEPWRLIAPMFLHMSFLHLFFNMSWVSGLGGMIERERGSRMLLLVVVVTHIVSAFTEYFWQIYGLNNHVILFGGFSGAVYGLIGFCWAYGEYNPRGYIRLGGQSIQLALIWMVLCFTGALGLIANGAHLGGLVAGLMMGWAIGLSDARRA